MERTGRQRRASSTVSAGPPLTLGVRPRHFRTRIGLFLPTYLSRDFNVATREVPMKSRIVQIGNSSGIHLPKVLLEEGRLADRVELEAEPGRIVIRRGTRPKS